MSTYYIVIVLSASLALLAQGTALLSRRPRTDPEIDQHHSERRPIGVLALLSGLVLVGTAALRWDVGRDYWTYVHHYQFYRDAPRGELTLFNEPGILILTKFAALLRDDYATMFGVAAVVTVGLSVWTIYRFSNMFAISILLYVFTGAWQGSFNGVRQYLACAIVFAGHNAIVDRKFRRYACFVMAASLFHLSALVLVFFYWIPRRQLTPAKLALLGGLAVAAALSYSQIGAALSQIKEENVTAASYFVETVHPARVAVAFAPLLLYVAFADKERMSARDNLYVNILVVNAAIMFAAAGSAYLARFAIYTGIFVPLALPRMLNARERSFNVLAAVVSVAAYAVFWYVDTAGSISLAPFHWLSERP